jgi:hypothetical protein
MALPFATRPGADPLAHHVFSKWEQVIESHRTKENVEIEIRFGRRSGSRFDTNVGEASFKKVLGALQKYQEWESTNHTTATVYYFEGGEGTGGSREDQRSSKRLTVNEETDEQSGQVKTRVTVNDVELKGHPLDVRLGISTEIPWEYDGEETSTEQKTKERWSFVRKNLSIDMTIIKGTPDDKDSDEDTSYQIELEILRPSEIQNKIELYNLLYKVFDVLKCV